jgi:hypothetical protein
MFLLLNLPSSVQQHFGLKHIDDDCLTRGDILNLTCKNYVSFSFTNHLSKLISRSTCVYVEIAELLGIDVRTFTFSYAELKTATEEFSPANKLGEGGFGPVFKVSG